MPRFSEPQRASYETPQLRRLAITALLVLWPDGLTIDQLAAMLNVAARTLLQDIIPFTDQLPALYEGDCPFACQASQDGITCAHVRLSLHNPSDVERHLLSAAKGAGFAARRSRRREDYHYPPVMDCRAIVLD